MALVKRKQLGSVHAAIERMFAEIGAVCGGDGIGESADFLGISKWTLYKQADPDSPTTELSLLRAGQLSERYGVLALAEWLADRVGCDLVEREPAEDVSCPATVAKLAQSIQDLADGHIDDADLARLRELSALIAGLIARGEASAPRQVRP